MLYFEDFQVGQTIELGSYTITKEEIIEFALKYDPQPFHIDEEKAKDSFFGTLVASGWQTAGLYMRMLVDGLLNNTISMGSPGLEELRWLKPVRPGDTLHVRFTVVELTTSRSRPQMGILKGKGEAINQNDETVLSLTSIGFFGRKPE
jgi:acyl dehydratase